MNCIRVDYNRKKQSRDVLGANVSGMPRAPWTMMIGLMLLVVCASAQTSEKHGEELLRLTADELVHRYVRVDPFCYECQKCMEEALAAKDPNQVFAAIAKTIDRYDPRTFAGRLSRKPEDAYWAVALLWFIDNNQVRARGVAGGRKALDAFAGMLERKRAAGHDSRKKYEKRSVYEAESSQYRGLISVNGRDSRIAMGLIEEYSVKLSDEELRRFSDFLVAKDPRYVSWSKVEILNHGAVRFRFQDMRPYYEAYLEFKKADAAKP